MDGFAGMEVKGDLLTDKDNAGAAILEAFKDAKGMEPVPIGSYRGFAMSLTVENFGKDFILTLKGKMSHRVELGKDARGNLTRIDNALTQMPERYKTVQGRLENVQAQLATAKAELGKPFPAGGGAERKIRAAGGAERRAEHRRPDAHGTGGGECGGKTPLRPRQAEGAQRPRRWGKKKNLTNRRHDEYERGITAIVIRQALTGAGQVPGLAEGPAPEEILHHSYEYTVREDILMSMEELTLSEAETRALLLSPSPMAILYDKFSDLETGYMDTIRDSIEDTAKDEAKSSGICRSIPTPADHAREQGGLDVYRASFRANVSCKDAIEAAIRDNYHDNRLDTAAVGQVAEQFGQERMLYVLAATVRHFDYDGRISRDNKRWANTIPVYENKDGMDSDRSVQFVVCSHPGLTDLFLTRRGGGCASPSPPTRSKQRLHGCWASCKSRCSPTAQAGRISWQRCPVTSWNAPEQRTRRRCKSCCPFPPLPSRPSKTAGACLP